jgi:very-short-patch-repair endonuclease
MSGTPHKQIIRAKTLRRHPTTAETLLWAKLRDLDNLKFRRQQPIGDYIVDFVCFKAKLIVEVDGSQHTESKVQQQDECRTKWLESQGFRVLRFWNNDVLTNIEGVISTISEQA